MTLQLPKPRPVGSGLCLLSLLLPLLLPAQERPVRAVFRDSQGALRLLHGVEGAWTAPILVPEGVLSAGFNGKTLWYKGAAALHVRTSDGRWISVPAPEGRAIGTYDEAGNLSEFYFPESAQSALWLSDRLGPLESKAGEPPPSDALEPIGDNFFAIRKDSSILAWRPGAEPVLIPLAEVPLFKLFLRGTGNTETGVDASFTMPPAAPGESSEARFRIRNPGAEPVLINRLSIDPGPFKTFDQFFPPRFIEPGGFLDFSVRFSPATAGGFSSTLYVNDLKVILNGNSAAASTIELELPSGAWQTLHAGDSIDLGPVERRATLQRRLKVTPAGPVTLTGAGFTLQPGAAPTDFVIFCTSDKPGPATGTLTVDNRAITLRVTVTDFPTPRPAISLQADPVSPARQARLTVKLSEPVRTAFTGSLSLTFKPDSGLPDDAAVTFLPQAVRTIPVQIAEGAAESSELVFQTGTTAGLITLKTTFGTNTDESSIRILPEPVALTAAKAGSASGAAEIVLTGFDTTRSTSKVAFTFFLKTGQPANPGRIESDITQPFSTYFKTITGSAFTLRANFPVSGTFSELEGVEVEITNAAGTRQSGRLRFE